MKINLSGPDITKSEIDLVNEVLRSGILSIGPKIEEFEDKFKEYFSAKHAIAVNSGTGGLHLLVKSLAIGKGDEVITTPFSFVASINCFLYEGAKPVFVDIDENTLNININKIEEKITERTKAILAVDIFGHPNDMEKIRQLADKYNLKVIEDSCEAIGSEFKGVKSGTLADGAVFAFYPNKQLTTGEGGMIITDDDQIADLCKSMRNQGRVDSGLWLDHQRLGYNYRLGEINAALGIAQMSRIDEILKKRQQVAGYYNHKLKDIPGIILPYVDSDVTRMSWFVYVIRLEEYLTRKQVMEYLDSHGVSCRPYFPPIHLQPYIKEEYGYQLGDFPLTEKISYSTIALPFWNKITEDEIDYTAAILKEAVTVNAREESS